MNTFQLSNPKQLMEPEELETWDTKDFDDVLPGFEASEPENELFWSDSSRWYADTFH